MLKLENALPARFIDMLRNGRAALFSSSNGKWYCYDKGCFKLFRKFETFALDLVRLLSDRCMTLSEIARVLALPYSIAKGRVYYYHYSGLLKREGPFYCLNDDHPQILFFLKLVTTRQFFDGKNKLGLVKIGRHRISSISVNRSREEKSEAEAEVSSISIESVLAKARKILRELSPCEEALIRALFAFWKETGSLYVETCDEVEVYEILSRFWSELGSSCRDSLELKEALARLTKSKVVFVNRRPCKIRLGKAVLPVGRKT